jgi:hypothetical protein
MRMTVSSAFRSNTIVGKSLDAKISSNCALSPYGVRFK